MRLIVCVDCPAESNSEECSTHRRSSENRDRGGAGEIKLASHNNNGELMELRVYIAGIESNFFPVSS